MSQAKSVIDAANAQLLKKSLTVLVCFVLAYSATKFAPESARSIAAHVGGMVPSVGSLRVAQSRIGEGPYLLFAVLALLAPLLAVYVAWNANVLARFASGVPRTGRGVGEIVFVIYGLYLPVLIAVIVYLCLVEVDPERLENTAGSMLSVLLLTTESGLFFIGIAFFFGLVMFLAIGLMALWLPVAFFLNKRSAHKESTR
jgi:hypothetical protein